MTPRLPERQVAKLWTLMVDMFGSRWTAQHGTSDQDAVWARGLHGLTGDDIARGLDSLARSGAEWPPSLPEFRALCEPKAAAIGAPGPDVAYAEACRNAHPAAHRRWSHPAVFAAAMAVGFANLLTKSEDKTRPRFDREFAAVVRRVLSGEVLPTPPSDDDATLRLARKANPETAAAGISAARAALFGGRAHAC